jgi:hypothetical protein
MKKKELIIITVVSITIAVAGLFQTLVYAVKTPPGFHYPLVHNYEQDYYWYLSLMRQGFDGKLTLTSHYTPEKFSPQFVNTFFPLSGMIAGISGLSLPVMYTILRVIGGAGLLLTGYMLLRELKLLRWQKITAFLFMITGAPFWFWDNGVLRQAGEFWTGFDPILRIAWLPHHTLANALMITAMIIFAQGLSDKSFNSNRSLKLLITSGMIVAAAVWLNPAAILIFFTAAGIGFILTFPKLNKNRIAGIGIFSVLTMIPVLVLWRVQNSTFPWTAFRDWERFVQYPINTREYMLTLGLIGVIGGIGIIIALKKRSFLWNMVAGWYLAPLIGLFLIRWLPVSNGRFLQSAGYIPAAILASIAVMVFYEKLSNYKKPGKYLAMTVIISVLILQVPAFISSVRRQMMYVGKNMTNPLVYIPDDVWNGLKYLGKECSGQVIAAPGGISVLIPAFSSCSVLAGHPTFTYNSPEKTADLNTVFSPQADGTIEPVINKYNIRLLWISGRQVSGRDSGKNGFVPSFSNQGIVIYRR